MRPLSMCWPFTARGDLSLHVEDVHWIFSLVLAVSSPSVALTRGLRAAEALPEEARVLCRAVLPPGVLQASCLPPLLPPFPGPPELLQTPQALSRLLPLHLWFFLIKLLSPHSSPGSHSESSLGLVRAPSPLASLRTLLLQRSVPSSRIITFLFFPEQIPSARKPLNKKRNTRSVTTDSFPWLLLCRGNCTHHLHSLLTAVSSSL